MRILRVAQKIYPEVPGGGTYHVHAMSRDQAAMGHDVTVLTVDREGERPHTEARDGYRVIRYPVSASVLGNDISAGVASYLRAVGDYDVLHAHSHLYFSTNLAALRRATGGPPLALTPDGPTSELIDHDGPVVLYVGRLVEGKRPQDAIRAVSQLSDELASRFECIERSSGSAVDVQVRITSYGSAAVCFFERVFDLAEVCDEPLELIL